MALTASQEEKMKELCSLIVSGEKRLVLKGSAGVGKTYLTNELIKRLKTELYSYGAIYVTAPTHKALSVLRTKIEEKPYIVFSTIHSALQLIQWTDYKTGIETLKKRKFNPKNPPLKNAQIVIVDESSMIGDNLISCEGGIKNYPNITFLFIGDDKQLPPVNEEYSPVFLGDFLSNVPTDIAERQNFLESEQFNKFKKEAKFKGRNIIVTGKSVHMEYPTVTLTEIVRQAEGSPIIELSNNLSMISSKKYKLNEKNHGYFYEYDRSVIIEKLAEVNGTDDLKYLAWTNADVDTMNTEVRKKIYSSPAKIELGESLIFSKSYGEDYKTSQEIKVNELKVIDYTLEIPTEHTQFTFSDNVVSMKREDKQGNPIVTWKIEVIKVYLINRNILVLHEDSDAVFKKHCRDVKNLCNDGTLLPGIYKWFSEVFASLTYNHAITIHKSQGSTFKTSIINMADVNRCRGKEKKALLYTAVTRASEKICLFNVY